MRRRGSCLRMDMDANETGTTTPTKGQMVLAKIFLVAIYMKRMASTSRRKHLHRERGASYGLRCVRGATGLRRVSWLSGYERRGILSIHREQRHTAVDGPFHSVNNGLFTGNEELYPNVSFHPNTDLFDFLEQQKSNSHTLVWMDLTSTSITIDSSPLPVTQPYHAGAQSTHTTNITTP